MNPEDYIDALASKICVQKKTDFKEPSYDILSGAFVWEDERAMHLTPHELGCLRAIFRFRTSLITQEADPRFQEIWERLKKICPDWIGFSLERCLPNEELAQQYRKIKSKRSTVARGTRFKL